MKLYTILLIILVFTSCSQNQRVNKSVVIDNAKIEKNKQTALLNKISELTTVAQRLERQGRGLESYRRASGAESLQACNNFMEDLRRETNDLEANIKNLPESYSVRLASIIPDLNECVTCSKKAMNSCVKSRATINELIKELFPQ